MKIFLIPGLGYDCRIFEHLDLKDYNVQNIEWIEPKSNELISSYAKRMFKDYLNHEKEITLIGHSFGGIIAQEISAIFNVNKIILISSLRSKSEIPIIFKFLKRSGLYRFFTKELCMKTVRFWGSKHGFKTEKDKIFFKSMINKHSNNYLQWALSNLASWSSKSISKDTQVIQIHGSNDKTLPFSLIQNPDFIINKGSHIMIYNITNELQKIIIDVLN